MLSASALDPVMAVVRGTIKLAGRLDLLMAEEEAVEGPLVIPMSVATLANVTRVQRIELLSGLPGEHQGGGPGPARGGASQARCSSRGQGARRGARPVLRADLPRFVGRFAKPDLESFTEWSPLLRHALGAALEGLLENKASIEGSVPWLDAVLSALATAKDDPAAGENFVTGLVNGKGYRLLFSKGLLMAADRLAPGGAQAYRQIAAEVLQGAAPLV